MLQWQLVIASLRSKQHVGTKIATLLCSHQAWRVHSDEAVGSSGVVAAGTDGKEFPIA